MPKINSKRRDPSARDAFIAMSGNPSLAQAMTLAFDGSRIRLNEAIQRMDDEIGEAELHVIEAIERFVQAVWKEL